MKQDACIGPVPAARKRTAGSRFHHKAESLRSVKWDIHVMHISRGLDKLAGKNRFLMNLNAKADGRLGAVGGRVQAHVRPKPRCRLGEVYLEDALRADSHPMGVSSSPQPDLASE